MSLWPKIVLILTLICAMAPPAFALGGRPAEGAVPEEKSAARIVIGPEAIRHDLDQFIQSQRSFLPQAEIRFKTLDLPAPFTLPGGKLDVEIVPSDPQILGSRRFTMIFRVDGRAEKNIAIHGELEALAPVAVAAGDLRRGTTLTSLDINLAQLDLARLRHPCFDPDELIGKDMKRSLRQGDPFDRGDVEFPPLVKRGEMVTMTARKGALMVTARGVARQNGNEGEVIRVRNSSSQKEIPCRVSAPGQVEVGF